MESVKYVPMTDQDFSKALNYVSNYRDHLTDLRKLLDKKRSKEMISKINLKIDELNDFLNEYLIFGSDDYEKDV